MEGMTFSARREENPTPPKPPDGDGDGGTGVSSTTTKVSFRDKVLCDSFPNNFKALESKGVSTHADKQSTENKGKSAQVVDPQLATKPTKNWIKKRQPKDSTSSNVEPDKVDVTTTQPNLANSMLSANRALSKVINKKHIIKEPGPKMRGFHLNITTWADRTSTTLPLVRVARSQFRLKEGP
ncbi:hypothetical protein SESBI_10243 [Sesbania bispinosa]|nr:hypothetical protein SESBI_10243 [Sesbania bispinosa]